MRMNTTLQTTIDEHNNDLIPGENEYIGDDGLIHCSICHEPKESRIPEGNICSYLRTHPRQCACERTMLKAEKEQRLSEERQRDISRLRDICFQAPLMHTWNFKNSRYDSEQLAVARKYVENWEDNKKHNSGLLFWGDVGTGKSYLAACIANALIDEGVTVRMVTTAEILSQQLEDRLEYIQDLCSPSLLILDDFGMERDTKFGTETICQVINTRLSNNKPLIVTTNLTIHEMDNTPDVDHRRIYSRIQGVTVPVRFIGPDLRKKMGKEKLQYMKKKLREDKTYDE